MSRSLPQPAERRVYSIGEITRELKNLLERQFSAVWLRGEISNFRPYPASGHFYFTLKDADAQISAVMFKGCNRFLKFKPEDGMAVMAHGRLSVYEAQGRHQIIVDHLEPDGVGALQVAFEQLKKKLGDEGLFDPKRKRALPFLPVTVGIVTSTQGAALHDMKTVLQRRFPNVNILVYPVRVQGEGAGAEIAAGVDFFSRTRSADVVIVGRGGGSIEDLWAFNEERVARAVAACRVPVVSAVGHETDFTICDFVADVRAPTPSAAAELCVPVRAELVVRVDSLQGRAEAAARRCILDGGRRLAELKRRIPAPDKLWQEQKQTLDDLVEHLTQSAVLLIRERRRDVAESRARLISPAGLVREAEAHLTSGVQALKSAHAVFMTGRRHAYERLNLKLNMLSPKNVLQRGYAVVRRPGGRVVPRSAGLKAGEALRVLFADGETAVTVD